MTGSIPLVALVDDDESVCRALVRVIRLAGYCVEPYCSAREFLERAKSRPELACLVLDVHLPDLGGLQVQRALTEARVLLPIVFISGYADVPAIVTAMRAGAEDFLMKPIPDTALHDAIGRAVARSANLHAQAAEREAILERVSRLTVREHEVLQGVLTGHLNKQIAGELGIAEKTIKHHRAHVMGKLGARSVAHLFQLAQMAGIPVLDDAMECARVQLRPHADIGAQMVQPLGCIADVVCEKF